MAWQKMYGEDAIIYVKHQMRNLRPRKYPLRRDGTRQAGVVAVSDSTMVLSGTALTVLRALAISALDKGQ